MASKPIENINDVEDEGKTSSFVKKKRPGKGSRKRTTEAFREKVGMKQQQERRNKIFEKYGLFDADASELEKTLTNMSLTVQPYAVPLTVSTRGVGFSATIEYSRMVTTWNFRAIVEICTVYQYYRVCLYLAYYKICESRSVQSEMQSYPLRNLVYFSEEVRQVLAGVSQVPVATSSVLGAIGKIEGSTVWHSYLPDVVSTDAVSCTLFLSPSNIREILEHINLEATPIAFREQFQLMCPIPGVNWGADSRIQNIDEIWPPDYTTDTLRADVHAFTK